MQELYYWGNSKGYTWKQLLYVIGNYIDSRSKDKYWYNNAYVRINDFFIDYSHNDNDGHYTIERRKGEYIYSAYYCDLQTRGLYLKHYFKPDYTVKIFHPKRNRIVDSYGRIIPRCQIKDALRTYIPNEQDNPKQYKQYRRIWHYGHKWRKQHDSRYQGDHGYFGNECKKDSIFKTELEDIFEEYGVRVKYNKGRMSDVKCFYTDWDRYFHEGIKRSWKRTRKNKQWM